MWTCFQMGGTNGSSFCEDLCCTTGEGNVFFSLGSRDFNCLGECCSAAYCEAPEMCCELRRFTWHTSYKYIMTECEFLGELILYIIFDPFRFNFEHDGTRNTYAVLLYDMTSYQMRPLTSLLSNIYEGLTVAPVFPHFPSYRPPGAKNSRGIPPRHGTVKQHRTWSQSCQSANIICTCK